MILTLATAAMGTRFELVLAGGPEPRLRAAGEAALAEIEECDARLSLFRRDSLLAFVNREAARRPVRLDRDTFELFAEALAVQASSAGAFDPTVAPLMRAWGFHAPPDERAVAPASPAAARRSVTSERPAAHGHAGDSHAADRHVGDIHAGDGHVGDGHAGDGHAADEHAAGCRAAERSVAAGHAADSRAAERRAAAGRAAAVRAAAVRVGVGRVALDAERCTVRLAPGTALDLGGIAKGHALDLAARVLREAGVERALLHGGTSAVVALGPPPDRAGWRVRVRCPEGPDATVELAHEALAVSAPHGRTLGELDADGGALGHVLDPRTGAPARRARLAAVLAPTARRADAWSTAVLVRGAAPPDAEHLTALVVTEAGATASGPLAHRFHPDLAAEAAAR